MTPNRVEEKGTAEAKDLWKDQLGLVSGNLLVWGLVLIRLWPTGAQYPTGTHFHLWSIFQGSPSEEVTMFECIVGILVYGLAIVFLAIFHVVCRGIWLAGLDRKKEWNFLSSLCSWAYDSIFLYLGVLAFVAVPFILIYVLISGLSGILTSYLSISPTVALPMTSLVVLGLIGALCWRFGLRKWWKARKPRLLDFLWKKVLPWILRRGLRYLPTLLLPTFLYYVALESCYTVDLQLNTALCDRSRTDIVEVYVQLGGATAAPHEARLMLAASDGTFTENLALQELGEGHYVSYILSSKLTTGSYAVTLEYPHASLTWTAPFLRAYTKRNRGFLLVQSGR
jgi:hypothetical protein